MTMTVVFALLVIGFGWHRRPPDFIIGDNYLRRWWVIPRNPWFNIYLHCIGRDDDDRALHDHPWWNVSIILRGAYREVMPKGERILAAGKMACRPADAAHRLEVIRGPVWSLFITGPRVREWGFHCPNGWRHWQDFCAPGDSARVGKGCE